ncbi:GerMN domain-containing protein [Phosphitispora sp. TUW77]|uniref:GerMN domain-containing protein n=1 Tax=Phosphitispora sp. TUW77 TaxID=3152361 RepID=UPI003AB26A97
MILTKVSGKKLFAGLGVLLMLGLTVGCTETDKYSLNRLKETHYSMITGEKPESTENTADKGQAVNERQALKETDPGAVEAPKITLALCFADQSGDYLKTETREITMVPGLARAAVQQLINGPQENALSATIPEGTRILGINIEDGLCTVDLSREFRDNHWGGSSGEILTVYSLVNTLTQFSTVEKVEILIEGHKIDTLAGHMDLSAPIGRNYQIIKNFK